MQNLKYNLYFKIGAIVLITLLLLIPTAMIHQLINERENRQWEAVEEVSSKWGNEQNLTGPFISIPYNKWEKISSPKDNSLKLVKSKEYLHILPEKLEIIGDIEPEKRNSGIYDIVVYQSTLKIKGQFKGIDASSIDILPEDMLIDQAELSLGISDLRGLEKQVYLDWEGKQYAFNSGLSTYDLASEGITTRIKFDPFDSLSHSFELDLHLKGSAYLYFSPLGKTTDVHIKSDWENPSFNGAFLPDERELENGFNAKWNILHVNRNYPQAWKGDAYQIDDSRFGIDLLLPVDNYQKTYRSVEYAILFIVFTFLVFFFIEIRQKVYIHPIQYILVGMALIVFYTLLLSISEHIQFNLAFFISALATILLIAAYSRAILKSASLVVLITGILSILYGFIFVIIQVQDYALLMGSLGIFGILALVMYFSRKIDWSQIQIGEKKENHPTE